MHPWLSEFRFLLWPLTSFTAMTLTSLPYLWNLMTRHMHNQRDQVEKLPMFSGAICHSLTEMPLSVALALSAGLMMVFFLTYFEMIVFWLAYIFVLMLLFALVFPLWYIPLISTFYSMIIKNNSSWISWILLLFKITTASICDTPRINLHLRHALETVSPWVAIYHFVCVNLNLLLYIVHFCCSFPYLSIIWRGNKLSYSSTVFFYCFTLKSVCASMHTCLLYMWVQICIPAVNVCAKSSPKVLHWQEEASVVRDICPMDEGAGLGGGVQRHRKPKVSILAGLSLVAFRWLLCLPNVPFSY